MNGFDQFQYQLSLVIWLTWWLHWNQSKCFYFHYLNGKIINIFIVDVVLDWLFIMIFSAKRIRRRWRSCFTYQQKAERETGQSGFLSGELWFFCYFINSLTKIIIFLSKRNFCLNICKHFVLFLYSPSCRIESFIYNFQMLVCLYL